MWNAFALIIRVATALLKTLSQITVASTLLHHSQHANTPTFFILCFLEPFISKLASDDQLWTKSVSQA